MAPSLRILLANLGVDRVHLHPVALHAVIAPVFAQACDYRPQDLRRGHYMDMKDNGSTLFEMLTAAGVTNPKSPRPYLDMDELEFDACMECHL